MMFTVKTKRKSLKTIKIYILNINYGTTNLNVSAGYGTQRVYSLKSMVRYIKHCIEGISNQMK